MNDAHDFSLSVVAHACDGPGALRERLTEGGLDVATIARLVGCSHLALARATKTGSAPRGLLIGLAVLATVVDLVTERGIAIADLGRGGNDVAAAVAEISEQSPLAARILDRLRDIQLSEPHPTQLSLRLPTRFAA